MSGPVHQLILASAGTGKTHALTNQFLRLLFAGVLPERILATTFTRKAAGEILDRVLERLVAASEDEAALRELADATGRADLRADQCRLLLARLTRGIDTFQVRTIDSFFVHLARLFALDLELTPGWRIASEGEDAALRADAMQDVFERIPTEQATELLRDLESGRVGRSVHDALLERADRMHAVYVESADDAWTGIDPGAPPSADAFAAAVDGLEQAATSEVPVTAKGKPNGHWVKAMAKLCEQVAAQDWDALLAAGLGHAWLSPDRTYHKQPMPDALVERLAPVVSRARHEYLARLRARNQATKTLLQRFDTAYSEHKRERGDYRFDDLPLALSPRAASEPPLEARELDMWFRLDSRIDHLLLDEFQDTSPIQWRILQKLASEIAADGTGDRTFFCVGDVKQSIYAFRQAEPRLLAELPRMLPGLETLEMHESYRSSQVILDWVNDLFAALADNPAFVEADVRSWMPAIQRFQSAFHRHAAARDLPGAARLIEAREAREGERDAEPLLERTVERAVAITRESSVATVGILLRDRKEIPDLIHRLRGAGVDASGEGGSELTDSTAVLAFVSLLHLADHPGDTAAAFHVASSPLGPHLGLVMDPSPEAARALARRVRERMVTEGLGSFCAEVAGRVAADPAWSSWDRARFEQLVELAFEFEARAGLRASDFVDHVRRQRVEAPGGARVRVMTIHGAKGLEFDAVILPELQKAFVRKPPWLLVDRPHPDGPIETVSVSPRKEHLIVDPRLQSLYDGATARVVEDGLCTLYVAMTRAKRRLELVVPFAAEGRRVTTPCPADLARGSVAADGTASADEEGVIWSHPESAPGAGWAKGLDAGDGAADAADEPVVGLGLAPSRGPRTLVRRSPSAEEGGRRVRVESLLGSGRAARRGTLVHRWLEGLVWIEDFALDEERALAEGASLEPDPETRREAFGMLTRALCVDAVRSALSRDACAAPADLELEVRREHAFSLVLPDAEGEEQLWSGMIDRLVVGRRKGLVVYAEIADYKTDAIAEADVAGRVAHYRPQLEAYGRVVAAQTGLAPEDVRLRLIFLGPARVVDL